MKRALKLACICLWGIFISLTLEAQAKPTLTILPFTGTMGGEEEIITLLLANQGDIRTTFMVVPCTGNFKDITEETVFPDSVNSQEDIIAVLQGQLNADFTVIVRTEKIGTANLALISLVEMKTLRQLGGEYRHYRNLSEFRAFVPDIAATLIQTAQNLPNPVPPLTVLSFYTPSEGVESWEGDILVQLLTIELANSNKYAVFPWALHIETWIRDLSIPYFGIIDPDRTKTIGIITHIPYILAGDVLNLGRTNLFMASIVDTEGANLVAGGDIEYSRGDVPSLAELVASLTGTRLQETPPLEILEPIKPEAPGIVKDQKLSLESLALVPEGIGVLGSPPSEIARDTDEVSHWVKLASFYIGKYEVSQQEYEAVMGTNPSYFKGDTFPVERVTWFDAVEYCNTRSIKEGLRPVYAIDGDQVIWNQKGNGYRLPTETEWEYACRAGTNSAFNVGDTIHTNQSNYDGTYTYARSSLGIYRQQTTAIGSFPANPWGLYDMHGNVYEWCWDGYAAYGSDDWVPNRRIVRGGGWYSAPQYLRSANRVRMSPYTKTSYLGFRVVRNAD
ncbi:MAG: formylglycine-generating enzyme family protein [Treponema sp.]|jgi:formylglycine-generating enzyme required for sulfatase activity|nr:formylglycine-generating enzyme family protein [Treponema sp.]